MSPKFRDVGGGISLIGQRCSGDRAALRGVNVTNHVQKFPGREAINDIAFDCPHCGKSLAIDMRGAGLMIHCPECRQVVQVPGIPLTERQAGTG